MTNEKNVVVVGAGGHALVVSDILRLMGYYIVGFLDDSAPQRRDELFGSSRILGGSEALPNLKALGVDGAIVAIGNCPARIRIADNLRHLGLNLVTAVHPSAAVSPDAVLESGCVIAAQAAVNPGAKLGPDTIVNTGAIVEHECTIAQGVHIGPGAKLAGRVSVGKGAWIGIGSTVIDRIEIGEGAFVGAGSVVLKNIPSKKVAYGVPARIIRSVVE